MAGELRDGIKIISPKTFIESRICYDIVLNVDSLTEMDATVASEYIEQIKKRSAMFLSINHESNSFTVRDMIGHMNGYSRYPYWMRKGYVEELVKL
jgi:hypothetical protein